MSGASISKMGGLMLKPSFGLLALWRHQLRNGSLAETDASGA
jgi:hypothetical protein